MPCMPSIFILDGFEKLPVYLRTSAKFHSSKVVHFPVETILEEGMEDVCFQHLQHVNLKMSTSPFKLK